MTITELYKTMLENAKNDNELVEFIAEVADFCLEIVSELFRNGQHLDIQELAARGEYI